MRIVLQRVSRARVTIDGRVKPPPKMVLDDLKRGVTMRNQLSHAGTVDPSTEDVKAVLHSVQDTLFLIDYYCGYAWALPFVRQDTRTALGVVNSP